jgi:hypothetical protein
MCFLHYFSCFTLKIWLTYRPQWIQTDLGGPTADLTVEESSKAISNVVHRVGKEDNGKFFNIHVPGWEHAEGLNQYAGENPPW